MLKLTNWLLAAMSLTLITVASHAQEIIKVKGRVISAKEGDALPGATIQQEKGNSKAAADDNGVFEIHAPKGSKLVVTAVGYKSRTVTAGTSDLVISMETNSGSMNEVVVLGYGSQAKVKVTAAVSSINAREIQDVPTSNLSNVRSWPDEIAASLYGRCG